MSKEQVIKSIITNAYIGQFNEWWYNTINDMKHDDRQLKRWNQRSYNYQNQTKASS